MDIRELNRDQLVELKQHYLCEKNDENGEPTYWSDLAFADEIVPDATVFEEYAGTWFSSDDFSCTMEG